ncbi:MAG: helix-turn-helix transcriptional regulator [Prevotellaceae bacterium]|jgi:AraC-like DNA-binding protein|nr:helix-turn-helix transcriptional regulator [Prevotellaceae bacterium]
MTQLQNAHEHLSCYLYDNNKDPIIQYFKLEKNELFITKGTTNQIIFLLHGNVTFSYGRHLNVEFKESHFLLFPHGFKCAMKIKEDSTLLVVNLLKINFCNHFSLEMLYKLNKDIKMDSTPYSLKINSVINDFLKNLIDTMSDGLKCAYLHELKQKELLYYMRAYYPKKDLFSFFVPILSDDIVFSEMIYKNLDRVKTITELANIVNYSVSGFKKRFVKVFGESPYHWILKEKAKKIYYEINCSQKSFKEISIEFDFSSSAHFDKFCKKEFGMSPGVIRNNNNKLNSVSNLLNS